MSDVNAALSGQFKLGDIEINRLDYGAMRIVGDGIWGGSQRLRRLSQETLYLADTTDMARCTCR